MHSSAQLSFYFVLFAHATIISFILLHAQRPFFSVDNNGTATWNATTPRSTGLAPEGMLYVPSRCKAKGAMCKLHLSLHGCAVDGYYDNEVAHLGFEAWGEENGIVVLFPRMQNHGYTVETTQGCWDAYAQTGADYAYVVLLSIDASIMFNVFTRCVLL